MDARKQTCRLTEHGKQPDSAPWALTVSSVSTKLLAFGLVLGVHGKPTGHPLGTRTAIIMT